MYKNFRGELMLNLDLKKYKDDGFIVYKNLLTTQEIKDAKRSLENFIERYSKKMADRDINFTKEGNINSIHNMNEWSWTKDLQKNKKVREIAKYLLEDDPEDFGAELFAKPAKVGLASPMHQDNYYWCVDDSNALTMWIALDDSGKKNGGVYYYLKTNKLGLLEHKPSYAPGSSQTIKYEDSMKLFEKETPELKAGDCLIHNTLVVHGSEKNESELSRRGWTIRFKGKKSGIDKYLKERYERELKSQIIERKKN